MQDAQGDISTSGSARTSTAAHRRCYAHAMTELNQFLSIGLMNGGTGEKSSLDGTNLLRLDEHPFLPLSGKPVAVLEPAFGPLDHARPGRCLCRAVGARGLDLMVLDQTRPMSKSRWCG